MSGVLIALIVALASIGVAYITARMNARTQKELKEQDYRRQDERDEAAKAERAEVVAQAAEAARLLMENQQLVAETAKETHDKLEVIRVDVNSNMTAAMQAEHDATVRELAMMNEVVDLKRAAGKEPTEEALVAIKATEERIAELRAKLRDRLSSGAAAAAAAAGATDKEKGGA